MPYESRKLPNGNIAVYKDSGELVGHTTPERYKDYMAALHINSGEKMAAGGEVEPGHWETIPSSAGTPSVTTTKGQSVPLPPFMAAGGEFQPAITQVDGPEDDLGLSDELNASLPLPPGAARARFAPTTARPAVQTPAPAPVAAPAAPAAPATPGTDLSGEMAAAEKLLGTGDNSRTALLNALNRYKQGGQVGAGIAAIGDAVASGGTLGKVNPHGVENVEKMLDERAGTSLENSDAELARREKAYQTAKELEGRDPNSQFSKTWTDVARKMLGKYGINIPAGASAAQVEQMLGPTAQIVDAHAKLAVMQNESQNRVAIERENAETRRGEARNKANEAIVTQHAAHPIVGPGRAEAGRAERALEAAGGAAPASQPGVTNVNSEAEYNALPVGSKYVDSTGKTKTKGVR